jgi:hypothetical protein
MWHVEMNGQLHAPATLPPGKEPPVTTGYEAGLVPEPVLTQCPCQDIRVNLLDCVLFYDSGNCMQYDEPVQVKLGNTRSLGSWVRIPLEACMYVCMSAFYCFAFLCRYRPCDGSIPRQRNPTKMSKFFTFSEVNSETEQVRGRNVWDVTQLFVN